MYYRKAKKTDILLIQIFLFALPFLFGGFYEFTSYAAQIFLLILIMVKVLKEKKLNLYVNSSSIALTIISIGYLFSCIYGVDRGMAFLGFLKFTVPVTFSILLMQYDDKSKTDMLKSIPSSGLVMIITTMLFRYLPFLPDEFYLPNGRMGGFFQYSNSFALYLLICIICVAYSDKKVLKKIGLISFLTLGILLSGSRAVFILTLLNFIFIAIKFKEIRKPLIALIGGCIFVIAFYVAITKNFNTIGRFLTTSINSSTLLGRVLYYKDALYAIIKHPFGLGYMGYSYIQPQIQTGVYKTLYVHNDFLQLALDIGVIPMIIFAIAIVKNLIDKRESNIFKQIIVTICIHILFDFDLQFMYIFLLLVLMLNICSGKNLQLEENRILTIAIITMISALYLYFAILTFLNYINKNELATKMYPIYTEANLSLAYEYAQNDEKKANNIASKILETNVYSEVAYNIKAMYYMQKQNWNLMLTNKQKALELSKYDISSYEEYILLLSTAIEYYTRNDDMESTMEYIKKVIEVPSIIQKIKDNTSSIAYKLKDTPNFELSNEMKKYIYKMSFIVAN